LRTGHPSRPLVDCVYSCRTVLNAVNMLHFTPSRAMAALVVGIFLSACQLSVGLQAGETTFSNGALRVESDGVISAFENVGLQAGESTSSNVSLGVESDGKISAFDWNAKSRRSKTLSALGYIHDPTPTSLEEMQNVKTAGMQKTDLKDGQVIYTFPVSEDKFVSGSLQVTGGWEVGIIQGIFAEFDKLGSNSRPADFLDVGANIGAYSIQMGQYLKKKGTGGKVIGVEGLPKIAHYFEASVVANKLQDTILVYNYAVSDGNMSANTVTMNMAPTNKGGSSIAGNKPKNIVEGGVVQDGLKVDVKVTTLDSILNHDERKASIFAVKMDIEGSEGHALRGAQEFLSKAPPCVLTVELNKDWLKRAGTPRESVLQLLRDHGFDAPAISDSDVMPTTTFRQKDFNKCLAKFAK